MRYAFSGIDNALPKEVLMMENRCEICGKPIDEEEKLCMDCQIEELIRESSLQIEM